MMTLESPNEGKQLHSPDNPLATLSREKLLLLAKELSIHEMDRVVTNWLAKEHHIYTTVEPRDPGSFPQFHREMETTRTLARLRDNAKTALYRFNAYKNEPKLGSKLASVFGAVTDIKVEGVKYVDASGDPIELIDGEKSERAKSPVLGTATADKITYTVGTKNDADMLSFAFQALLSSGKLGNAYPLRTYEENGKHFVELCNMDEYTNRVVGNALSQLMAEEDFNDTKTILPQGKSSLQYWKEKGETFHPDVEARLVHNNERYQTLGGQADKQYRTEELGKDLDLLGTDVTAVFQVVRDAFRPTIHHYRGGDHHNKEQNPDKSKRLLIETGVDLVRDIASGPEAVQYGPLSPRTRSTSESLQEKARESLQEALKDKLRSGLTLVAKGIGAGTETLTEAALLAIPNVAEKGKIINQDKKLWLDQKIHVAKSREIIAELIVELLLEERIERES